MKQCIIHIRMDTIAKMSSPTLLIEQSIFGSILYALETVTFYEISRESPTVYIISSPTFFNLYPPPPLPFFFTHCSIIHCRTHVKYTHIYKLRVYDIKMCAHHRKKKKKISANAKEVATIYNKR